MSESRRPTASDDERESIWTVPTRWKTIYFNSFMVMIAIAAGFVIWYEVTQRTEDSFPETVLAVARDMGSMIVSIASLNLVLVEIFSMLSRQFDKWLSDRQRAEGRAEGLTQGRTQGRVEERAEWVAWTNRQREALAKGEPFDEPSPAEKETADIKG